jgi:hypothetical protein
MIECKAVSLSCANFQSYYIPTALPCLAASKSFVIRQRTSRRYLSICDAERKSDRQGDSIMSATAYLEAAVPRDQRPVNELAQLKADLLYSWGSLELNQYVQRLVGIFAFFMAALGGPIAYQTFNPSDQPFEWILSASVGSLVVVAIVVVRIFLGWAYVSDRLLSATYAYEETGWYDGQTFVKPPEVLTRDRLLGMYETKPVLQKLKVTLIGSGVMLLTSSVLLLGIIRAEADEYGMYGRFAQKPRQISLTEFAYSRPSVATYMNSDDEFEDMNDEEEGQETMFGMSAEQEEYTRIHGVQGQ